jgi:hypothetical protein
MSRTLTAAYTSAIASGHLRFAVLVEMYFDSGTSYYALSPNNIVYNGNTYLGIARIASIEPIKEVGQLEATGLSYHIVANSTYIALALQQDIQGRKVIMRLALLDSDYQIIATPIVTFQGRMDTMAISLGNQATIKVSAESRFASWDSAKPRRYNSPDQHISYPNDSFFDFVPQMVSKELGWGVKSAAVAAAAVVDTVTETPGEWSQNNDGE